MSTELRAGLVHRVVWPVRIFVTPTLLRAAPRFTALAVIATAAAEAAHPLFLASESTLGVIALGLVTRTWRQLTGRYGFTVATSHDGIRIRRGLLSTVAETIPFRRVQAVRLVQPLLWRRSAGVVLWLMLRA